MTAQSATAMQTTKGSVPVRPSPGILFDQFNDIYNSIAQRAFEMFEGTGRWPGRDLEHWLRAEEQILHPVHMDIREADGSIIVRAEVPGFSTRELEIAVEPRFLRIAGKREGREEEAKGKSVRCDWCADQILRIVDLPVDVDTSKVNASLKDGILTIELAKAPHAKTVHIEPRAT
ncbi:MAG TPA: Hsp20 family protein [Verrucomicrobiae bacterium]|nr:Hsp20 family protein [Verrucomicrobiae bacterium]